MNVCRTAVARLPLTLFWLFLAGLLPATPVRAAAGEAQATVMVPEFAERRLLYEGEGGASCAHFIGDVLAWERRGGDWRDAGGRLHGDQPFAEQTPGPQGAIWDVTGLVRQWATAGARRGSFFLRALSGPGYAVFHSRESKGPADWPMLVLELADGSRELLAPTADTQIDCSTYRAQGRSDRLSVFGSVGSLLQFELPARLSPAALRQARLLLSALTPPGGGGLRVGVFEAALPQFPASPPRAGLAAGYPGDKGIEAHPDVVFSTGFDESARWRGQWAKDPAGEFDVVASDADRRFAPLFGRALSVNLKKADNYGADLRVLFKDHGGEVDELFLRYYLRLGDDWNPTVDGGKLPGLAGTYGEAGWGGRPANGRNGWSLRGNFALAFPADHPLHGLTQLGSYAYHADMAGPYGEYWFWPGALLERNRWYAIEQQVRLNRVGAADGEFRVWIDGRPVFERLKLRMRTVERLHIEMLWLNVWHGGVAKSPYDQHLYIDNVVVAKRYIGPLAVGSAKGAAVAGR